MAAISESKLTPKSESLHISPTGLLDQETVGVAIGVSLPLCVRLTAPFRFITPRNQSLHCNLVILLCCWTWKTREGPVVESMVVSHSNHEIPITFEPTAAILTSFVAVAWNIVTLETPERMCLRITTDWWKLLEKNAICSGDTECVAPAPPAVKVTKIDPLFEG